MFRVPDYSSMLLEDSHLGFQVLGLRVSRAQERLTLRYLWVTERYHGCLGLGVSGPRGGGGGRGLFF